ncbi:MAG TPA: diiron oxygenase [Marmoricola sp.]
MTATMPDSDRSTLEYPLAERLLNSSARHSYDPDVDLDWEAEAVPGLWWMQPERMSLYGTPLWDSLTDEQRIELSKHEVASIASVGLWFELVLMKLLLREVYKRDPRSEWVHYALTEIGDECRHSTMFGKAIGRFGVPAYGPRPDAYQIAKLAPVALHGPAFYAATLIGEEPVDRWQRDLMHDDRIQPLIRMVARIHVMEEARHVSFARQEVIDGVAKTSPLKLKMHQLLAAEAAYVTMRSLVNPKVYAAVGIDPEVGRHAALGNPHYRATIAWMGEKVMPFLEENQMIGTGRARKLWHASFLLP